MIVFIAIIGNCSGESGLEGEETGIAQTNADFEEESLNIVGVCTVDAYLSETQFYPVTIKIEQAPNGAVDGPWKGCGKTKPSSREGDC